MTTQTQKYIVDIDLNKKITVTFHDNTERNRNVGISVMINNNQQLRLQRDIGSAESILKSALINSRGLKNTVRDFISSNSFENYVVMKNASVVAIMGVNNDCSLSVLRIGSVRGQRVKYTTLTMNESKKNASNQTMHYFGDNMSSFTQNVKKSTETIKTSTVKIEEANTVISNEIQTLKETIARLEQQLARPASERFVEAAKELKDQGIKKDVFTDIINSAFETKTSEAEVEVESDIPTYVANKTKTSNGLITMAMFEARDYHHLTEVTKSHMTAGLYTLPEVFRITSGNKSVIVNKTQKTITKE